MDPRLVKAEGLFFPLQSAPHAAAVEAIRAEAMRARDAAIAAGLRRAARGLADAVLALASAVRAWPARRAAYSRLSAHSDRELADIGLTRADLPRVFEPGFRVPANDSEAPRAAA